MERFIAVCDSPTNQVPERIVIKVQIERNFIIEAEVLGMDRIALENTRSEREHLPVLTPNEETAFVTHAVAETAEVRLGQFLEVQLRAVIDLQVERVDFVDDGRDVIDNSHIDGRRPLCRPQLQAQFSPCSATERALHVFIKACVIDIESNIWKTRNAGKAFVHKAFQHWPIFGGKFLKHNESSV